MPAQTCALGNIRLDGSGAGELLQFGGRNGVATWHFVSPLVVGADVATRGKSL